MNYQTIADCRIRTDRELIGELSNRPDAVAEEWENSYNMDRLLGLLTPKNRRIATAAVELYKRRAEGLNRAIRIGSSQDIYGLMRPLIADLDTEEFWLIPLVRKNGVLRPVRISSGAIDSTLVDVRVVIRRLLELGATRFAMAHNHPSGNASPSPCDDRLTAYLRDAARFFNITLMDHLIITADGYYSYFDACRLEALTDGLAPEVIKQEGGAQ